MGKRTKTLAILACVVSTASCYACWQDRKNPKAPTYSLEEKLGVKKELDVPKPKAIEDAQDVLYRPPAIVEFLGIPFGMDIDKFSGRDSDKFSGRGRGSNLYEIPKDRIVALHPLLELVTARENGLPCRVIADSHQKIVRASCERNSVTASELREFIDKIRKEYPEIEEIKKTPYDHLPDVPGVVFSGAGNQRIYKKQPTTNHRLFGTTKSGISVEFIRNASPILRESDGELIYHFVLILAYEAPIKAEEDRQARIKRKIAESDF
jgi:hypothetical protein